MQCGLIEDETIDLLTHAVPTTVTLVRGPVPQRSLRKAAFLDNDTLGRAAR